MTRGEMRVCVIRKLKQGDSLKAKDKSGCRERCVERVERGADDMLLMLTATVTVFHGEIKQRSVQNYSGRSIWPHLK